MYLSSSSRNLLIFENFEDRQEKPREIFNSRHCQDSTPTMADVDEDSEFVIRPLQLNDLPFAVALEESSFPPNEAATPEKVQPPANQLIVD
jgi:hypothetical protein